MHDLDQRRNIFPLRAANTLASQVPSPGTWDEVCGLSSRKPRRARVKRRLAAEMFNSQNVCALAMAGA